MRFVLRIWLHKWQREEDSAELRLPSPACPDRALRHRFLVLQLLSQTQAHTSFRTHLRIRLSDRRYQSPARINICVFPLWEHLFGCMEALERLCGQYNCDPPPFGGFWPECYKWTEGLPFHLAFSIKNDMGVCWLHYEPVVFPSLFIFFNIGNTNYLSPNAKPMSTQHSMWLKRSPAMTVTSNVSGALTRVWGMPHWPKRSHFRDKPVLFSFLF